MVAVNGTTFGSRGTAIFVLLLTAGLSGSVQADDKAGSPTGWRLSTPEAQGMRSDMLADMLERIRWNEYRIHSVSIVRNGRLVLDAYFNSWPKGRRHAIYSVTKSVMSALIGIAIDKRFIAGVDTPILGFFPDRTIANVDPRKRAITLEHLLTMTTGLRCRDSYRYGWAGYMQMRSSPDWTQHVLDLPMAAAPGKTFEYCNGASFLLSAILAKATGSSTFAFAREHLFAPLGITNASWSASSRKIHDGCCGLSITPHAMAKIGWLFINNGRWNGRQVISAAWVKRATRRHVDAPGNDHYGYQWWRDKRGYYMAVGYKGQWIFVLPKKKMVVVFTGNLPFSTISAPKTLLDKFIVPSAASESPMPPNLSQQKRLAEIVAASSEAHKADRARKWTHIWRSRAEGVAHEGLFVRRAPPAFSFRIPRGSRRDETLDPAEIMRMRTRSSVKVSAIVTDIPDNLALDETAPIAYAARLRRLGSGVEVRSHRKITLGDGTDVYKTDLRWRNNGVPFRTVVVSAIRNKKLVFVATHHRSNGSIAAGIVESLRFPGAR